MSAEVTGEGEPLVLVHGFPLDRRMWRPLIDALGTTHLVIAPDLRGFGESPAPAGVTTMEDYADDLAGLLDGLGVEGPVALCGLSMGGYVGFAFFRRYRERLARLVLCDTKAAADSAKKKADRERTAEVVLQEGTESLATEMPNGLLAPATRENHRELVEHVAEMIRGASRGGVAAALRAMAARGDSTRLLGQIDVPTLLICGEADVISPPDEMRQMAERIPEATYVEIPSAGHLAPLENPEPVVRAVRRFLGVR
jgi:pimeloyl-ACP methyl ester carboxylesterase